MVKPTATTALKAATSAALRGSGAKSAAGGPGLVFQAAALVRDHVLPQARARSEQEYRKAVEGEADRPAAERPEMPGVLRAELLVDRVEAEVYRGKHGGVDVEAQLRACAAPCDTVEVSF